MDLEFDPAKDRANLDKHGISLARATDLESIIVVADDRFEEMRYRFYGVIDGKLHCLAATLRGDSLRVISLRRAHVKEYRRHVE